MKVGTHRKPCGVHDFKPWRKAYNDNTRVRRCCRMCGALEFKPAVLVKAQHA